MDLDTVILYQYRKLKITIAKPSPVMTLELLPLVLYCPKYLNTVSSIGETILVSSDNQFRFKELEKVSGVVMQSQPFAA